MGRDVCLGVRQTVVFLCQRSIVGEDCLLYTSDLIKLYIRLIIESSERTLLYHVHAQLSIGLARFLEINFIDCVAKHVRPIYGPTGIARRSM